MDWKKRLQLLKPTSFRDIFDANTASDIAKRKAQGQPALYQDQQKQAQQSNSNNQPVVNNQPRVVFQAQNQYNNPAQKNQPRVFNETPFSDQFGIRTKPKVATPSYGSNPFKQIVNRTRDVFDANTPQDFAKRNAEITAPTAPNLTYKQQQESKGISGGSIANNPLQRFGVASKGFGNMMAASPRTFGTGLAQGFGGDVKIANKAQQDLIDQTTADMQAMAKLYRTSTDAATRERALKAYNAIYQIQLDNNAAISQRLNQQIKETDPLKMGAAFADMGLTSTTLGVGGATRAGVKGAATAAQLAGKSGFRAGAKELATQTALTTGLGSTQGAASVIAEKGKDAKWQDIAQGEAAGGLMGAGIPLLGLGFGSMALKIPAVARAKQSMVIDKFVNAKTAQEAQAEARKLGIEINDIKTFEDLALAPDRQTVKNILDGAADAKAPVETPATNTNVFEPKPFEKAQMIPEAPAVEPVQTKPVVKKPMSQIEFMQKYPQLSHEKAGEYSYAHYNAATDAEREIIETKAAIDNKEAELLVQQSQTAPQTAIQAQKAADTQVINDTTANVSTNPVESTTEAVNGLEATPQNSLKSDLNTLGVTIDQYLSQPLPTRQPNKVLNDLILATEDLKKEGIPNNIVERVLNDPNAPLTPTEFKNAVRREAGKVSTIDDDVTQVQIAAMEAYNKGDFETAQMLNDLLKESGNNILDGAFPAKGAPIEKTPTSKLKNDELYSAANADVSFGVSGGGKVVRYKPDGTDGVAKDISYDKLSTKTRKELIDAENELEVAKSNSTGPSAPNVITPVIRAKNRLRQAQSNAIEELGLQDYATIETLSAKADGTTTIVQKTKNDRFNDWLEQKYNEETNPIAQLTLARDMTANPQKYKAQFEAESSTPVTAPIEKTPTPKVEAPKGAPIEKTTDSLDVVNQVRENKIKAQAEQSPVVQLMLQNGDPARRAQLERIRNEGSQLPPEQTVVEPTAKPDVVPENIDPVTGAIKPKTIDQVFNDAPDPATATNKQIEQHIGDMGRAADEHIAKMNADLEANGTSWQEFHDEIQRANREKRQPEAWAAQFYDENIRPFTDQAADFGGALKEGQRQNYYLPQTMVTGEGDKALMDGSLVDILDIGNSGFANKRGNKIALGELDNSTDPLRSHFIRNASLPYKNQLAADKLIKENAILNKKLKEWGHETVDLTPEQALNYTIKKTEQVNSLAKAAEKGGVISSDVDKFDYVDSTRKLGVEKGAPTIIIESKLSPIKNFFGSSKEAYNDTKFVDLDGKTRTLDEATGFKTYTRALSNAYDAITNAYKGGKLDAKAIKQSFDDISLNTKISEGDLKEISDKAIRDLERFDNHVKWREVNGAEPYPEDLIRLTRINIIAKAHRTVGRVQMNSFLEQADIKNPALKKLLNQDAKDMMLYESAVDSIAQKAVNIGKGTIYRGALGYNPLSASQNLTEIRRVYARYGANGVAEAAAKAANDMDIVERYGIREVSLGGRDAIRSVEIKAKDWYKPMTMFNLTEEIKDAINLHAAEAYIKKTQPKLKGIDFKNAVLDEFDNLAFKGGKRGSLGFNKQKTMGLLMQFMQYSFKDWKYTGTQMREMSFHSPEGRKAIAYVTRKGAADVATYLALNAALGVTASNVFNYKNPSSDSYKTENSPIDMKAVNFIKGFTGAGGGLAGDMYLAIRQNMEASKDENPTNDTTANVAKNQLKRDAALLIPGGNQIINKTGGFITDMRRGYNENSKGVARFSTPVQKDDTAMSKFKQGVQIGKGLVLGKYQTDEAKNYFGSKVGSDLPFIGSKFKGQQNYPATPRYDAQIKAASNIDQNPGAMLKRFKDTQGSVSERFKAALGNNTKNVGTIKTTIQNARDNSNIRGQLIKDSPEANKVISSLYETKKLPNGKTENNTISKEKWAKLTGNDARAEDAVKYLKDKAIKNNKDFGDPIDPIFDLPPNQRKDIIALRAMDTGNDIERKSILSQEQWYKDYKTKEDAFYKAQAARGYDTEGDFVNSERVKQYYDLSSKNPSIPDNTAKTYPLISEYYNIKNKDADKAKAYYKANVDALGAQFEQQSRDKLAWINDMRALEGALPLSQKDYENVSFGFEPDEAKLFKELYYKLGNGYSKKYNNSSSGTKKATDQKQYLLSLMSKDATDAKAITLKKLRTAVKPAKLKSHVPIGSSKKVRIKLN